MAGTHHIRPRAWVGAMLCSAVAALAGLASAQSPASADQRAYEAALKCFVANGHASGLRTRAGQTSLAAAYDASARTSFDAATRLGRRLGYSGQRIDQDFGIVQARELPQMVTDTAYFRQAVATCRALGLMPRD